MNYILYPILQIADILLSLLYYVVIIDVVFSWLEKIGSVGSDNETINKIKELMKDILEPIYRKIRSVLRPINGLDFSPLILIIALSIAKNIVFSIYRMI